MILPGNVAQEQQNKQEKKSMIIALALEIYPRVVPVMHNDLSRAARTALSAAKIFVEETNNFEV